MPAPPSKRGGPIRVMIVDDSVVVRHVLSDELAKEPDLEVAGVAANGAIALRTLDNVRPDVLVLDIDMPETTGLQVLWHVRKERPGLKVVIFSSLAEMADESDSFRFEHGVPDDFVPKPSAFSDGSAADVVHGQLAPAIRRACRPDSAAVLTARRPPTPLPAPTPAPAAALPAPAPVERHEPRFPLAAEGLVQVVAIGSSTGGPDALAKVIEGLPGDLQVPVVIVQHMPPVFTHELAKRLDRLSDLSVAEAQDGDEVRAGRVLIAPGGHHMLLAREHGVVVARIDDGPPENSCRPAVDPLFRTVAELYGANALGVILTGMGNDGHRGCEALRARGGAVVVQNEATCVVWGMPRAVEEAGLAEQVLPLDEIAEAITLRVRRGRHADPQQA